MTWSAVVLCIVATTGCGSTASEQLDDAVARTFAEREAAAPGYTLLISTGQGHDYVASFGAANLELGAPASPATVYHIGSITKQFTAAAVMMLAEEGRLRLDDPVADILPEYAPFLSGTTIKHLLNHTSGIRNYTSLAPQTAPLWTETFRHDLSEEEMIDIFIREPRDFLPGEGFSYSNSGYFLAGAVIKRVSGMPYEEFLQQKIFEPLGLESAGMCRKRKIAPQRADGYVKQDGDIHNTDYINVSVPYAAGALCMNARDLARWSRALHEGEVISQESLGIVRTPTIINGGIKIPYGLGVFIDDLDGVRRVGHSGLFNGFSAVAWYYPESGLVTVLLSNLQSSDREDDVVFLEANVMRRWRHIGDQKPSFASGDLDDYAGCYRFGRTRRDLTTRDGTLYLDGAPLTPVGPDLFLTRSGPPYRVKFIRRAGGNIAAFVYMRGAVSYAAEICEEPCCGELRENMGAP